MVMLCTEMHLLYNVRLARKEGLLAEEFLSC